LKSAIEVRMSGIEVDAVDMKVPDQWHTLLHRLWSKAVGAPDYIKAEWIELESILLHAATRMAPKKSEELRADGPKCCS
jgi:hypothetical protein